jgi:thioesterase component of yersiniabactin synthetase
VNPVSVMLRPCLCAADPVALHLVICPFAGASSGAFRSWRGLGEIGAACSLAVYPGRDQRMHEPCAERIDLLAAQLAAEIAALPPAQRRSLLLAGHSMGAQVAFEACMLLERRGSPPAGLVLSGCHAPHLRARRLLSHLDDRLFVEQLIEMGGLGPELQAEPPLLARFLPLLRADFRATENYRRERVAGHARLFTPTLLLYGSRDGEAWRDEVDAWRVWLADASRPVALAGDHFYVTKRPRAFVGAVLRHFEPILSSY